VGTPMTNLHFLKPPLHGLRPHAAEAPICDAEPAASRPHHAAKIITSANCCAHLLESRPDQCTDIEMTESLTAKCGLSGSLVAEMAAPRPAEPNDLRLATRLPPRPMTPASDGKAGTCCDSRYVRYDQPEDTDTWVWVRSERRECSASFAGLAQ
jgi:hypothetical protein